MGILRSLFRGNQCGADWPAGRGLVARVAWGVLLGGGSTGAEAKRKASWAGMLGWKGGLTVLVAVSLEGRPAPSMAP